jgi:Domain of unknown function DUF1828
MICPEIIKKYLTGLHSKIWVEEGEGGCIVHTPFLDPNNEFIMAFVEAKNGRYRISDMSQTDEFLFLHGLDINPQSKADYFFKDVLKRYEVKYENTEIYIEVDEEHLASGINAIIGSVNSIDHLIFTLNPRIAHQPRTHQNPVR